MQKLSSEDILRNNKVYDAMTAIGNPDFWFGSHKEDNYERLSRVVDFTGVPIDGLSCLDVGCGTGDFSSFLKKKGVKGYLGIDIYEPSITFAKEKYPNEHFILIDILEWDTSRKFDYVFCSGGLSTRFDNDNYEFIAAMISKMWNLSKIAIAFNFLLDVGKDDLDIFKYSLEKVEFICKKILKNEGHLEFVKDFDEAQAFLCKR